MKKRFAVLSILSTVMKVLGIISAAGAVLGGIGSLIVSLAGGTLWSQFGVNSNAGFMMGIASSFGILLVGILYAVILYGYGELLTLLISMENNTFKTVKLLEDVIKDDQA